MLTNAELVKDGHPILRQRVPHVPMPPSAEDTKQLKELHEFIINTQDPAFIEKYGGRSGIGIAAPQFNICKRMIAIHIPINNTVTSHAFFNPQIVSHSAQLTYLESGEGCLSIDDEHAGIVLRYNKIKVRAFTLDGEDITLAFSGLPAICIQHEIDHLNGILFYDHIDKENPYNAPKDAIPLLRKET